MLRSYESTWAFAFIVALATLSPQTYAANPSASSLSAAALTALGIPDPSPVDAAVTNRSVNPNSGPWSWTYGPYRYDGSGNVAAIGTQTFHYDTPGRLIRAELSRPDLPGTQTQSYVYDTFGNMTQRTTNFTPVAIPVTTATNHLASPYALFDDAGNLKQWQALNGPQIYQATFDALNMVQDLQSGSGRLIFMYTADDERIWTWDFDANVSHWKLRDLDKKVLRDFQDNGTWTLSRDYIYREGLLLAAITPTKTLHFSLDHLGTPRVNTDDAGVRVGFHHYFPFGEEWTDNSGAQEGEVMKFTGHERDADPSGATKNDLDYMHARYYSANMGRFLTADPKRASARSFIPQTWNRYSYALNNPVKFVDVAGLDVIVSKMMQDVVKNGLRYSPDFAAAYYAANRDHRIIMFINPTPQAGPGARAETDQQIAPRDGKTGKISKLVAYTKVPTTNADSTLDQRTAQVGHEIAHQLETIRTDKSIKTRVENGEPGVWLNTQAGAGHYESTEALAAEEAILQQLQLRQEQLVLGESVDRLILIAPGVQP